MPGAFNHILFRILNAFSMELDEEALLSRAVKKTGLDDWGGVEFRNAFQRLVTALKNEARLSEQGRYIVSNNYLRLLCNLLHIVEDWKRFPEIGDVSINAPVFILGFPRTGTTYLHNLLSLDPSNRALKYWELLYPSPPPDPAAYQTDPRIRFTEWIVWFVDKLSPDLATVHKLEPQGAEECCFIFDHLFLDRINNHLVFDVPSYAQWYDRYDPVESYRFHKKMLQMYGWKFNFDRFVLKAPRHLYCLGALLEVYPDARIVWTHRDPLESLPSLCSLMETARRIVSDEIDCRRLGELCLKQLEIDFASGYEARLKANPAQFLDVSYRQLVSDPVKTVQSIYEYFKIPYTDRFGAVLKAHLDRLQHRQQRLHKYSLEQYGLDAGQIYKRLKNYYDTFSRIYKSENIG